MKPKLGDNEKCHTKFVKYQIYFNNKILSMCRNNLPNSVENENISLSKTHFVQHECNVVIKISNKAKTSKKIISRVKDMCKQGSNKTRKKETGTRLVFANFQLSKQWCQRQAPMITS